MLQGEIIRYILLGLAIFLGWLAGNGAVFLFNKLPGKWLTDYHETPLERGHPSHKAKDRKHALEASLFYVFHG